jgi:hypothetical protein
MVTTAGFLVDPFREFGGETQITAQVQSGVQPTFMDFLATRCNNNVKPMKEH